VIFLFNNLQTVALQVIILFILIAVGFISGKTKILSDAAAKSCADLVLLLATPCVIIQSFQRKMDAAMLSGLLTAALVSLAVHMGGIALARLFIRDPDEARKKVLRFGVIFSNAGYMALPLQQALLGADGVFYGASYIAVFNIVLWTYGLITMSGERKLTAKKLVLNPGIVAVAIGFVLFFCSVTLPPVISEPVKYLAYLNTPLPMLVIGFYLSGANLLSALKDKRSYLTIGLRLVVIPALALLAMWLCGIRGTLLVSCAVAASTPVAVATTMFATKYRRDTSLSVNLVTVSTLLSILTMPVIVAAAQLLA